MGPGRQNQGWPKNYLLQGSRVRPSLGHLPTNHSCGYYVLLQLWQRSQGKNSHYNKLHSLIKFYTGMHLQNHPGHDLSDHSTQKCLLTCPVDISSTSRVPWLWPQISRRTSASFLTAHYITVVISHVLAWLLSCLHCLQWQAQCLLLRAFQ